MELRDAKRRYDFVYTTQISQPEHYEREAAILQPASKKSNKTFNARALPYTVKMSASGMRND